MPARRVRRAPADAQRLILDAAEACMGDDGPAGLRLTRVAARAGVSHPTLLHHFGSRDALIAAVHRRAVESMRTDLTEAMRSTGGGADVIGLIFAAYRNGLASRLVWMFQSGFDLPAQAPPQGSGGLLADMVGELQAVRQQIAGPAAVVDAEETAFIVHLVAITAFGDAIIGDRMRNRPDAASAAAERQRFEHWFARVVGRCVADRS